MLRCKSRLEIILLLIVKFIGRPCWKMKDREMKRKDGNNISLSQGQNKKDIERMETTYHYHKDRIRKIQKGWKQRITITRIE